MKNFYQILALLFASILGFSQVQEATLSLNPEKFNEDESVTLTFSGIDASAWSSTNLYLWAWFYKNGSTTAQSDSPNNGTWNSSSWQHPVFQDPTFAIAKAPCALIPLAFVTKDGVPFLSFGVMGGDFQPQAKCF